ncbi:hypothetical protein [Kordiimonas sp.]|uniref:hypothetical protein n=1 Tax=Kordiimonas sp. TaxID=1970157 RepID=UPI003A8F7888
MTAKQKPAPHGGDAAIKSLERDARKNKFLEQLFLGHTVVAACKAIGADRRTPYRWAEFDVRFKALWDAATGEGDPIEREAVRRAIMGTRKPIFRGGEKVAEVVEHSDTLLMFLLKARDPARFGTAGQKPKPDDKPEPDLKGARDALLGKFAALDQRD